LLDHAHAALFQPINTDSSLLVHHFTTTNFCILDPAFLSTGFGLFISIGAQARLGSPFPCVPLWVGNLAYSSLGTQTDTPVAVPGGFLFLGILADG